MHKDITSTFFGFLIAYLLPGAVALYSLSFWSDRLREVFATVSSAKSDVGLILSLVVASLVAGLVINVFRHHLFERLICRTVRMDPSVYGSLVNEQKLQTFMLVIEETFRYHQFYGNLAVQMPFLCATWLKWYDGGLVQNDAFMLLTAGFVALEFALPLVAYELDSGAAGYKPYLLKLGRAKSAARSQGRAVRLRRALWILTILVFPALYLIGVGQYAGGAGTYKLFAAVMLMVLSGIAVGANAIVSLRRFTDRAHHLKEVKMTPDTSGAAGVVRRGS
jgi:hypothetical protein